MANLLMESQLLHSSKQSLKTRVLFRVQITTGADEIVKVVGSDPALGSWIPLDGHTLYTSANISPCWYSSEPVLLPLMKSVSYKYALCNEKTGIVRWEDVIDNRVLTPTGEEMVQEDDGGLCRDKVRLLNSLYNSPRQSVDNTKLSNQIASLADNEQISTVFESNDSLIIVALELPIKVVRNTINKETIEKDKNPKFSIVEQKFLLLPCLHKLRCRVNLRIKFVGWCGIVAEDENEEEEIRELLRPYDCAPVFVPKLDYDEFIRCCFTLLWPVFHGFYASNDTPFDNNIWGYYQKVNQLYGKEAVTHVHTNDLIWIHDYHLMLVPMYITRKIRRANIGFFLHKPFPSTELFRTLTVREEILRGLLCADLLGFQLFEYARHFLNICKRLLGLEHQFSLGGFISIDYCGRQVMVKIGHVHIQYDELLQFVDSSATTIEYSDALRKKYGSKFIFGSVDRCDSLSGLVLKLRAFSYFLEMYPYAASNVILLQYVYPTSFFMEESESFQKKIKELADGINESYGEHIFLRISEIQPEEKYALFNVSNCLLDTSIREGLNLNPFEYICCHHKSESGTALILSEFTGSSVALVSAKRVNPWKIWDIAKVMDEIINSPKNSGAIFRDQNYLQANSTMKWADDFLSDMKRAKKRENLLYLSWGFADTYRVLELGSQFQYLDTCRLLKAFSNAKRRSFFFDYEGTLAADTRSATALTSDPNLFSKGASPSKDIKKCLRALVDDARNTVFIISGRDHKSLDEWFGDIEGLGLGAEHGYYIKVPSKGHSEWTCTSPQRDFTWKIIAMELMKQYVKRTQGSFIENKGSTLVFQYRDADPEFGSLQAKELSNYLSEALLGYPVTVMSGKGYVEVKLRGVNKGVAVRTILDYINLDSAVPLDFALCIGDDRTDEDMFDAIHEAYPDVDDASKNANSATRCTTGGGSIDDSNSTEPVCISPPENTLKRSSTSAPNSAVEKSRGESFDLATSNIPTAFTVVVGRKPSKAHYYLLDVDEVTDVLDTFRHHIELQQQPRRR